MVTSKPSSTNYPKLLHDRLVVVVDFDFADVNKKDTSRKTQDTRRKVLILDTLYLILLKKY